MVGWLRGWLYRREGRRIVKDLFTLKFLEGRRTQVNAVIMALLTLALNLGYVTQEQYVSVMGFLTSIGLLTAAAHKPS